MNAVVNQQNEDALTCTICLEELANVAELARPNVCQHQFCRACLERLCGSGPRRCPNDRKTFDRICVRRRSTDQEAVLDASTLAPLRKIFTSNNVPFAIGCLLLAILWAKPNFLLALHTLAIGVIYWQTDGIADWTYYAAYSMGFYFVLVPLSYIGIIITAYACCSCFLVLRWCQQVPELASRTINAEKVLLGFTVCLVCLVYPILVFSPYTLVQIYSYVVCAMFVFSLQTKLCESQQEQNRQQYTCCCLLFSCLLLTPYICQLEQLSLLHLAYTCLLALYLVCRLPEPGVLQQQQPSQIPYLGIVSKLICYMAPSVLLFGFSIWVAMYTVAAVAYCAFFPQQESLAIRLKQRVPLLFGVNIVMVALLLPWKLFGLLSYLACLVVVSVSCWVTDKLVERMDSLPCSQLADTFYQLASLGILLPAMLF